ncbi:MAG: BACON domain-containing protein, partial [Prosthecobacter sp.]|nr:BACON domain-containing protein [Prosthecobacter sp.]
IGNTLVFTAASTFKGMAFTYVAKDAFGDSAMGTVDLLLGTCEIDPGTVSLPPVGTSYNLDVTATGAWSAVETLPWVIVGTTPGSIHGNGNGFVGVLIQTNTSVSPRTGTVNIGGQTHTINQAGVSQPTLSMPALPIPEGIVSGNYSLEIPTTNFPVTYTVTNMPPGLTMDREFGFLGGKPTKAGAYAVKIKAANAAGTAATILSFTIVIQALPPGLAGSYHGFVERDLELNDNLGSRLEMTITGTGMVTGKVISGVTALSFSGPLDTKLGETTAEFLLPILRKNDSFLALDVALDGVNLVTGDLLRPGETSAPVNAWRNIWSSANKVSAYYRKPHTFVLEQNDPDASLPQGYGYGSWPTVAETTGVLTITGRLADGNAFTTGTFMGPRGQILVYQPLYGNKGSFAGVLDFAAHNETVADNSIVGVPTWYKPAPAIGSKDTNYKDGFGPIDLQAAGSAYPIPPPGDVVMGLPDNTSDNARLSFASGGLTADFDLTLKLYNPTATGLTNKADVPPHFNMVKLPLLTATTGAFSGDFTLSGATPTLNRKVLYQGQIVRLPTGAMSGYGYFLLPESTAATAKKNSGSVLLEDATP